MKTFSRFTDILLFRIDEFIRINISLCVKKDFVNEFDTNFFFDQKMKFRA